MLAARTDKIHAPVRAEFRRRGYSWQDTFRVHDGFPDGIVSGNHLGSRNILIEVKGQDTEWTPDEIVWWAKWPGEKEVVACLIDVARLDGRWELDALQAQEDRVELHALRAKAADGR